MMDLYSIAREVHGIEGINDYIDLLARTPVLLGTVRKSLDMAGSKKPVQAVDNLPLEITHWLLVRCIQKKTIWYCINSSLRRI